MKHHLKILLTTIILFPATFLEAQTRPTTAKEVVAESYNLYLGKSGFSVMNMSIVRPNWTRSISLQNWSLGDKYYITLITAPARDKGQVFLKSGNEMWNFIPAINRTIKIPPSMMMQSWMGSDFTNNDLVKQNSIITDYTHRFAGEETIDGHKCYIIYLEPLPEAAVVWGKIKMWIDKKLMITYKTEFYDTHNKIVKTETASDVKNLGGRLLPAHMEMVSDTKKGHKTIIDIQYQEFNLKDIKRSFFSIQNIKRLRRRKL